MGRYRYRTWTGQGVQEGVLEAGGPEEAARILQEKGQLVLEVREEVKRVRLLPARVLEAYFRQFVAVQRTGAFTAEGMLSLLEEQIPPRFRPAYAKAVEAVRRGSPFHVAFAEAGIFPSLAITMIRVGEETGHLAEVLNRLSAFYGRLARFNAQLRSALTYPTLILILAILMTWVLSALVVPTFASLLKEMGVPLPLITKGVILLSDLSRSPLFLATLAGLGFFLYRLTKTLLARREYRLAAERFLLRLPVVGRIVTLTTLSVLARTLALGQRAGLPVNRTLNLVGSLLPLLHYREALSTGPQSVAAQVVGRGRSLHGAFSAFPHLFPRFFLSFIQLGEASGNLDEMTEYVAGVYDEEVEYTLKGISSLIEPLLLVFVGVLVGGIMLSVLLPYFSLLQNIGGLGGASGGAP